MKSIIYILTVILSFPFLSKGQATLKTKWKLYQIFDIETNNQLFADLKERSTLVFTDSTFEGRATCNILFGNYLAGTKAIKLFNLGTSLKGCNGRREEIENFLHRTFSEISAYYISTDTLTLTDKEKIKLIYIKEE